MNQYVQLTETNTLGQPMVDIDRVTDDLKRLVDADLTPAEALQVFIAEVPDHGLALSDLAAMVERLGLHRRQVRRDSLRRLSA